MSYQIELFHSLLNNFLQGEAALLTTDGDVLAVRGQKPATYGTLTTSAQIVGTYLKLNEGDIAILNDPYSGGSTLNEMTFIMALSEDLLWISRKSLESSFKTGKSIEDEGIRIPPTPLLQNGRLNETILAAIQSHPLCPPHFGDWMKKELISMTQQAKKLIHTIEAIGFTITGELIEEYLQLSKDLAQQKISESASGETRVDVVLDSGELLRLNMDISDGKISLDFGGTSAGTLIHLTESAAFGTCFHTISRHYGFTDFANSGSFGTLSVTKPSGCWLIAKYPAPIMRGMTSGVAALQWALETALNQINKGREKAPSCTSPLTIEMQSQFASLSLSLMGGQGAQSSQNGICARIQNISIEKMEHELPIKILRFDHRQRNESKEKFAGGRGLRFEIEALGDLQVTWHSDLTINKLRVTKNCTLGQTCEVSLNTQEGSKLLPSQGSQRLLKGEILFLSSGSGGGFGLN